MSSYVCAMFIIFYIGEKKIFYYFVLALAFICVFVSGIRALIMLTLLLFLSRGLILQNFWLEHLLCY